MARFEFKLPDIGEGVTEGEIVSWLVKVGDSVSENQDMVEVMTDKATVTIGAPKSGTIAELRGKEGDVVPVGQVLVVLDLEGGVPEQAQARRAPEASEHKAQPERPRQEPAPRAASPARALAPPASRAAETTPASAEELEEEEAPAATAVGDIKDVLPGMAIARAQRPAISELHGDGNGSYTNENPLAAPATRKLARELGIDLRRVRPTGPAGRVTREDVERYRGGETRTLARAPGAAATPTAPSIAEPAAAPAPRAPVAMAVPERQAADERMPIRGLRKRIFENMARSKHTAAHFTFVDECDVSALKSLRARLKPHAEAAQVKLSFLPFIVKAVIAALKRHPTLNAVMDDAANELVLRKSYDIGIATATEAGLMVPVVRSAELRSIIELSAEIERLADAARAGKAKKEDLGGSSFTITSLGKLGGLFATPVVNYPEVAILGVHEIKQRPVVKNDQIVVGEVMLLSLSFDHRVIDGHVGAAFARDVIGYLEDPDRLFLELT